MKFKYLLSIAIVIWGCKNSSNEYNKELSSITSTDNIIDKVDPRPVYDSQPMEFSKKDTVNIGPNRAVKSLREYFSRQDHQDSICILLDAGTYYSNGLWLEGEYLTIEGQGSVNLYCTELYENVIWISGKHIVVRNIHMKHFAPGKLEGQNCSGRVIVFDNAHDITIENCDLNGCGLAGLHDNLGNSNILIKNNYIHNNSIGAYTDIDGGIWLEEVDDHPVFTFENNRMENNGTVRTMEPDSIDDYIKKYPKEYKEELRATIKYQIEEWRDVENPFIATYEGNNFGDYHHIEFEDDNGESYDFGFGNNNYGNILLFFDDEQLTDNPKYLGKLFKIYWEWKVSSFPCCSGEYETAEAYLPSIIKLELIEETNANKK